MIKRIIKAILLNLLKDDYEVQMQVTKIANPELADEIEKPIYPHRPPFSKSQGWWTGGFSKQPYVRSKATDKEEWLWWP